MNGSDSRQASELDQYLARLDSELARVPVGDRQEILREMRSHVVERTHRSPYPDVDEVLASLGSPAEYARQFLTEAQPGRTPSRPGLLDRLARLAAGRWTTLPLLGLVLAAYAVAVFTFVIAVWKLVEPDATGLWIDRVNGDVRSIALAVGDPRQKGREVLGYSLVPIGIGIAGTIHVLMSALLRRVMRDDARHS